MANVVAEVAGKSVRMVPLTVYEPDGHESIITVTSSSGHMERVLLNLPDTMEYAALCQWVNETPDLHSFFRDYHRLQIEHWIWSQVKLETRQLNRPPDVLDVGAYDRRTWVGPGYRTFGFADTKPAASPLAPAESLNLRAIQTLRDHFELPVGYSDHSEGSLFPLIAATLGAVVVEKTLTLSNSAEDPARATAVEPEKMHAMVQKLRALELSLGDGRKRPASCEEVNRVQSRRSIVAACDIRAYESVTQWMLSCKRPGSGIEPGRMERLVGMQARRNLAKDRILRWDDLAAASGPLMD